jgi:hypothetical protein
MLCRNKDTDTQPVLLQRFIHIKSYLITAASVTALALQSAAETTTDEFISMAY